MSTATIRISEPAHRTLRQLAQQDHKPMQAILEQAIEAYRRQRFLEGLGADFAVLRENEAEWNAEQQERSDWDAALSDGDER
jgi:predicted transcriptional regulator